MKQYRPTTPSRRHTTGYDFNQLTPVNPLKSLTKGFKRAVGRNNQGRITSGHRGAGVKRLYREIDFKQIKTNVPARVFSIEYDPNRTARIAQIHYVDGQKSYILAPQDLKIDDVVIVGDKGPIRPGNRMRLKNIPQGTIVHNIELFPGQGGRIARSAGSGATVLAGEGGYIQLAMPSSEMRLISGEAFASIGQLSNPEHALISLGKAGRSRWLGKRPKVRGTAMNPVDHPHGGGEGRQGRGTRRPKTRHGKVTGGHKTRNLKKRSSRFIIRRRTK
ncbi:MAG TPA: 50S ribosomal protein L2 [Candidatus Paceibacterota bacterium]|nr:50S ribosomal protein L2 [Candidatus Paceibacterota bacterium]